MKYANAEHTLIDMGDNVFVPVDESNPDYRRIAASGEAIADYEAPPVDLAAYTAAKRYELETGGITVSGASILTDRASQAMINGAYNYVQANPSATIDFKGADGWITLDATQMSTIADAVGAHVQACFAAESSISADIQSGTITSTAEIDSDSRWP